MPEISMQQYSGERGEWRIHADILWRGKQLKDEEKLKNIWNTVLSSMSKEQKKGAWETWNVYPNPGGDTDISGRLMLSDKTLGDTEMLKSLWERSIMSLSEEDRLGIKHHWNIFKGGSTWH